MKFFQKLDGAVHVSAREYDVACATAISEGQLVKLKEGLVVGVDEDETGAILGIAAENHTGVTDAIDPRADGKKIFVIDDPNVVMQCKAPEVTATGGSETTLQAEGLGVFSDDDFNGGYVKLIRKAEKSEDIDALEQAQSKNTDVIGQVRRITDFTDGTLTLEEGGTPEAGDVYALFPPVGFTKGSLGAGGASLALTGTAKLPVMVMGRDLGLGKINLIAKKHLFAAEA